MTAADRTGDNWLRSAVRDKLAENPRGPKDVVPATELTAEQARALSGQPVTVTTPGRMIFDPDGMPIGTDEPVSETGVLVLPFIAETEHKETDDEQDDE